MTLVNGGSVTPFVQVGNALIIVSFDRGTQAAALETAEDRSLNLALRRRRVRSEMLRIPLDADESTKAFLTDVVGALSGRRLLILARDLSQIPEASQLAKRLCDLAESAYVIVVGEVETSFAHPSALVYHLQREDRESIEMLADALIIPQAG